MENQIDIDGVPVGGSKMTLREIYAGIALKCLVSANLCPSPTSCAKRAVKYANAIIKELNEYPYVSESR